MSLYAYRLWNNVAEEKRETVNSREIKCFVILLGIIEMFFLFFFILPGTQLVILLLRVLF